MGTSRRTLRPEDITIANNLFVPIEGPSAWFKGHEGERFRWRGNVVSVRASAPQNQSGARDGLRLMTCELASDRDGMQRPGPTSCVQAAAEGTISEVTVDIDGQRRLEPPDVGCDQISDAPKLQRPLNAKNVGPAWLHAVSPKTLQQ